jgi:hypothetical protein
MEYIIYNMKHEISKYDRMRQERMKIRKKKKEKRLS